jgi:hypothetical protein
MVKLIHSRGRDLRGKVMPLSQPDEKGEPDVIPSDELRIGFGSNTVAVRGIFAAILIVVTALSLFVAYILWESVQRGGDAHLAAIMESHNRISESDHNAIRNAIDAQTEVLRQQKALQEEQNYMLFFATPDEKEKLRMWIQQPPRFHGILQEYLQQRPDLRRHDGR